MKRKVLGTNKLEVMRVHFPSKRVKHVDLFFFRESVKREQELEGHHFRAVSAYIYPRSSCQWGHEEVAPASH